MSSDIDREKALRVLPVLVDCAQKRQTITYGELAESVGGHHRQMGRLLGYLRDSICQPRRLPLINVLVVTKDSGLPGKGFLPGGEGYGKEEDEYRSEFELLLKKVYDYQHWDGLLAEFHLQPVDRTPAEIDQAGREYIDYEGHRGSVGEGEAHERLKRFVAQHPETVGVPAQAATEVEEQLLSGDRCDVVFRWDACAAVVEVKCGDFGELVKGIYQAIKYRAVLKAQEGYGDDYPVDAFLVAYTIADDIREHAQRFGITCVPVAEERLSNGQ